MSWYNKNINKDKSKVEEVFYMTKRVSRIIATVMLLGAIVFLGYALNHPEKSFPWSNTITFTLYAIYIVVMIILYIAPFKKFCRLTLS